MHNSAAGLACLALEWASLRRRWGLAAARPGLGNVITEDLVFMFESMGVHGVDLMADARAAEGCRRAVTDDARSGCKGCYASISRRPGRAMSAAQDTLPLPGVRVIEFTHMVMGPTCGMILGDLGAEVIKVEPITGDNTRKLIGSGAGFFSTFNRNKKSLAVDIRHPHGREIVHRLVAGADVFSENFKGGTMAKLGLDYAALSALNPRLIYVSHKGFPARALRAPHRARRGGADDGRACVHDRARRPSAARGLVGQRHHGRHVRRHRALAALAQRDKTGRGQEVQSALFENNVFLVAQHMMQFAVTGKPAAPMPSRISAWAIYDVFTVARTASRYSSP